MSYHKYILFTGGLHLVLYGTGFQYFMGYQSHSHFLLPSGWPANRQASGSQQARVAEEDNFHSRFCPVSEMTRGFYVILRSLNVSFYICCELMDIFGVELFFVSWSWIVNTTNRMNIFPD